MTKLTIPFVFAIIAIVVLSVQCLDGRESPTYEQFLVFNEDGELMRPEDYRSWIYAGGVTTPLVLDSTALFPDFQNVYIDPVSFAFWKANGYFREGTVMVKELLRATDRRNLPIGKGFVQGKTYDVAVTIKDTIRFPDVPGGWEYFDFKEQANGDFADYSGRVGLTLGCIACHAQSEAGYGPFPELYAPLRDAKGFGDGNPENLKNRRSLPSERLKLLSKAN